ncbi:Acetylcholine receptor subunit alpha-type acr-16 [Melipona quadrifasciata]|uniref:Acetylcholine receptor subunit alpha-type acr-16 n=1 Tax=Melipona quadrifasciata TaxID=166423 RepID=A0A0M8ZQU6_9HYME|nr:Acetylcholine receptor subunit alpha-type acr-16 [Melipona quadrifasciata]
MATAKLTYTSGYCGMFRSGLKQVVFVAESLCGRHEKRLLNELLSTYNTLERPVANESEPLEVRFGITLQQIIDVMRKRKLRFVSESLPRLISEGADGSDSLLQTLVVVTTSEACRCMHFSGVAALCFVSTSEIDRTSTLGAQPLAACASRVFETRSRGIVGPLQFASEMLKIENFVKYASFYLYFMKNRLSLTSVK